MRTYNKRKLFTVFAATLCVLAVALVGTASAKSLYVIDAINARPTPISVYNVNPDGTLTYQATDTVPRWSGGAVGLAAWFEIDPVTLKPTGEGTLFVTYEFTNRIQLVDVKTMLNLGYIDVTGAYNMAGIVYDSANDLVYTVDRYTDDLYVYSFDNILKTLTLQGHYDLPGLVNSYTGGAYGITLDEENDLLYVGSRQTTVRYYNTSDWSLAGSITVAHTAINVAVDVKENFLYSGGGFAYNYYLDKYDLNTSATDSVYIATGAGVMGLGVDPDTGHVYCTTGRGHDDLRVYDSSLALVQNVGQIGSSPTGLVISKVGYKPALSVEKDDGLTGCVDTGDSVTYTITYENTGNIDVNNAVITDTLDAGVTFVSVTGGGTYDPVMHTVTWDLGTVVQGESGSVLLTVSVNAGTEGTTLLNKCTIDSDETPPQTVTEYTDICEEIADLLAVEYRWGEPAPGYSFANPPIFEGWMDVRIENRGAGDAFNVTGEIMSWPINTTVPDTDVTVGDIPAGGSAWSVDTFTTHVDMAYPVDPCEEIFWRIEYDDAAGVHHVVENVPEFPPGEGPPQCP